MNSSSMAFRLGASSSSSSSSSFSIRPFNYDVFLSFRGVDVRRNFLAHLYQALKQSGINTYKDSVDLERGEEIAPELLKAIEESRISIVVLSINYAESRWCLDELLKILDCRKVMERSVLPIFYDVDPTEVRHQKGNFGKSFDKLGDELMDNAKMLKWKEALERIADISGLSSADFRDEAKFIQKIIAWVNAKISEETPLFVANHLIGIESRIQDIYQHLSIGRNDIIRVVGIFGAGGIGKTTISKDIFNRISSQFNGSCFLKDIRETSKRAGGLIQLQNTLLHKILGTNLDVCDIDKGINVIKHRLRSKRILLILDDVDELVQLEKLVGDLAWLYSGSRIIITTRDQQLLTTFEVDSKYELNILNDNEALQLFRLHAFKKHEQPDDYVEITNQVIKYAQGLPLALKVLGSYLKGQSIQEWKSALVTYKSIPHKDIQRVLLVSYEGLDHTEKEIFLDIAFFFKGETHDNLMKIFEGCDFYPEHGIKRLKDKCLITIEGLDEYVGMHDLLQDMGREIVRLESPKEPSKRSRLWFHKDIRKVLEESPMKDTNKIEGMIIEMPEGEKTIILNPQAFERMKRLRVFINRNAIFSGGPPNHLSKELRVLDCSEYPYSSLPPNFHYNKLIIFKMHGGFLKELGTGFQFKNLTTMSFYRCEFLTKIPDLSSVSNLNELIVRSCPRLVEVDDSLGSLNNLRHLLVTHCSELRIFPRSIKLRSLRLLDLFGCSSLTYFPEIGCEMKYIDRVDLRYTAVEELPVSIANLTSLCRLLLKGCKNLMRLPVKSIFQLQHLSEIDIGGGPNLEKKMGDDRQSLLDIESTTMEEEILMSEERLQELVPPVNSNNESNALQVPNLPNYFQLESHFFAISSFLTIFASMSTLTMLGLYGTKMVSLPTSIKGFVSLKSLNLTGCDELEEILELPPNIINVYVHSCKLLKRFAEVSKILEFRGRQIKSLRRITLERCDKMHEKIWNYKVPNTLLWKGHYDAAAFPENQIPEWIRYQKEFLENEISKRGDNDVQLKWRNNESVINIEGPHYLENISGIVIYSLAFFFKKNWWDTSDDVEISSDESSDHVHRSVSNISDHVHRIVNKSVHLSDNLPLVYNGEYRVVVKHFDLKSFGLKVLDILSALRLLYPNRVIEVGEPMLYTSMKAEPIKERGMDRISDARKAESIKEEEKWMYGVIEVWLAVLYTDARKAESIKEEENWI